FPPGVLELMRLQDLGPKRIAQLYRELQVGSIDELAQACRDGRVRALKGFGEKTEAKILESIASLRRMGSRLPLGSARPVALELLERLRRAPGISRAELAGSIRRWRETVKDVDLVAAATEPAPVFDWFLASPAIERVLGRGDTKCSVILREGLQVDVRVVPEASFATALHHFTGSKEHHLRLRRLAQEKGLKISEWAVERTDDGAALPIADEQSLYAVLGLPYLAPELREDAGELEAALDGRLPRLVEAGDLRGYVHVHSDWSDGKASILELARAVRERGGSYLTITDHSRTAFYAGGLTIERLREQWDEIARVQEQVPEVRLLRGAEVDILEDGSLDYPDQVLEQLDVVVASVHSRFKMDEEAMTRRLLAALDNPHLHILGHPTGRLIGKRPPYGVRIEQVLDKAARRGVAVEVNGNPERLDLSADHVRLARERGIKLVLTTDAHSVGCLDHLSYSVATARRGWATREEVLNTLPFEGFLGALRAKA
ncbi:MAG: DNA polymerase/3'-5' exonuclease PolX, partial [Myxococcales bacterium]